MEIEIKLHLGDSVPARVTDELKSLTVIEDSTQTDIYFDALDRDMIGTEECLRIRSSNTVQEITWKPPSTQSMQDKKMFWKEEVDLKINDTAENAVSFLTALGYTKYVEVVKHRKEYKNSDGLKIAIDTIVNLGTFLEVEYEGESHDEGELLMVAFLEKVGLAELPRLNIPYRDLVKKGEIYYKD